MRRLRYYSNMVFKLNVAYRKRAMDAACLMLRSFYRLNFIHIYVFAPNVIKISACCCFFFFFCSKKEIIREIRETKRAIANCHKTKKKENLIFCALLRMRTTRSKLTTRTHRCSKRKTKKSRKIHVDFTIICFNTDLWTSLNVETEI